MTTLLSLSLSLLCSFNLGAPRIGAAPLEAGVAAPNFEVNDVDGNSLKLDELLKTGPVVMVFFPKANSPYCTQELQSFVSRAAELKGHGATVLAISTDKTEVLKAFRADLKANFPFVSDGKAVLARRYNAAMPVIPQARRRTYVIDQTQHVAFAQEDEDAISLKGVVEALATLAH